MVKSTIERCVNTVAKQKKKLKKSKKVNMVWCTSCCRSVPLQYPHTCYDYARILATDLSFGVISVENGARIIRSIANRQHEYIDFTEE